MMVPRFLIDPNFLIEFGYSLIVMVSCLIIYFKTSEIYKLTSHEGIKYFRMTFLFFAITYFLRFFSKILVLGLIVSGVRFQPHDYLPIFSFLTIYASFMTTFYLLYGLSKKNLWKFLPKDTDILHLVIILLSSFIIMFNVPIIFIIVSLLLLFYMLFVGHSNWKKFKKKTLPQFYIVYLLLIIFSMLNIVDILIPNFFGMIQFVIYLVSISLFLIILYKVLKILNVESNGRKKKQA